VGSTNKAGPALTLERSPRRSKQEDT